MTFDETEPEWWINGENTNYENAASTRQNSLPTSPTFTLGHQVTSGQQHSLTTYTIHSVNTEVPPWTDSLIDDPEEAMMTISDHEIGAETQLGTTVDFTSSRDDGSSTTKPSITITSSIGRDPSTESISTIPDGSTKTIMPTLDSVADFHEDDYRAWTNSQRDFFQVAIILSLVILCAVCIAVFVIMAVLIHFMACKKRSGYVKDLGGYERMPLTKTGQDKTHDEIREHSV